MDSDKIKILEDIFHSAQELPGDERAMFLEEKCSSDPEMKANLEELLSCSDNPKGVLESGLDEFAVELLEGPKNDIAGRKIGRYEVERLIGEGGMGNVYLARDTKLARPVALKILSSEMTMRDDRIKRFVHEARSASALNHPHILTIYEIDEYLDPQTGEPVNFISMEFIEGKTLQDLIYYEVRPLPELLKIIRQVSEGLAKAHEAGIIHRDLKPENLMISNDGFAKILDFGLAKLTDPESELHALQRHQSRPGVILGTLGYMSPEQIHGDRNIDNRSDIFSLGCILYEVLAKRKAFEGDTTVDSLHAIVHKPHQPLEEIIPGINPQLVAIVDKCLAKDRLQRFQDIRDVVSKLRDCENGMFITEAHRKTFSEDHTRALDGPRTQLTVSRQFSRQRKQLTVMFADITGITDMLDGLDPEIGTDILEQLWEEIHGVITKFEGRIDQRLSDRFVGLFGAEKSQESDPESAVRAGLELITSLERFFNDHIVDHLAEGLFAERESTTFCRIGISTGTVVVGVSGEASESMMTGPTITQAKKLSRKLDAGSLLISKETYRLVGGIFVIDSDDSKNRQYFSVVDVKPRAFRLRVRGVEGIQTKMVGRESELSQLLDTLHVVFEDIELQRTSVVGEAGIGKSRLLYEFQAAADLLKETYYVFRARGIESKASAPFAFLRDIFFFRLGIFECVNPSAAREKFVAGFVEMTEGSAASPKDNPEVAMRAQFIGHLIGMDFSASKHLSGILDDPEQIQDRALNYAAQFFESVAAIHPIVMFLDDLQWADTASLEFIDSLARESADTPILLAGFMRPAFFENHPHWGEGTGRDLRIDLKNLSKRQARGLVGEILQNVSDVPVELRDSVVENGAGNPLYIEELIKMLIEQGVVITSQREWTVDLKRLNETSIPPTLTGIIQARLDRLSAPEKAVMQRAAVVGIEFWDEAVKNLNPGVNVQTVLSSLRTKELLYQRRESAVEGAIEFVFKYALLRDVTYESVLLSERKVWHESTAAYLAAAGGESGNELALAIAEHFKKGGNRIESSKWFAIAGEQAFSAHAPGQVIRLIEEALSLRFGGNEDSEESPNTFRWRELLIRSRWSQADFEGAIADAERLLSSAEECGDLVWQAKALVEIAVSRFEKGDALGSAEASQRAIEIGKEAGHSTEAMLTLSESNFRLGRALLEIGNKEKALECGMEYLKISEELGDEGRKGVGLAYHLLGAIQIGMSRYAEAQEYFEKDLAVAQTLGNKRIEANELNSLGEIMRLRGKGSEALVYYERGLQMVKEINNRSSQIMITSNIGGAKVLAGEYPEAEELLRELIESVGDKGHFLIPESYCFLAQALIGQGKTDEARAAATRSLELSLAAENSDVTAAAWHLLGVAGAIDNNHVVIDGIESSADRCFKRCLEICELGEMEDVYAQVIYDYADYLSANGHQETADGLTGKSVDIAGRLGIDIEAKSAYIRDGATNR